MKRFAQVLLALIVVTSFANIASAGNCTPRIDHRRIEQRERIRQGVRSGQLTRHETRHLRVNARHIHRVERRAKADGQLSRRERVHINRMQDRESRRIFRFKHNGRAA